MWNITSPNSTLSITIKQNCDGALSYTVSQRGIAVTEECSLGIVTSVGSFTDGLEFVSLETAVIDETYSIPAGKKAVYVNRTNETALRFQKGGVPFIVRARAYDEGAAFRYEIPLSGDGLEVEQETTEFRFTENIATLWLQGWVASYEAPYDKVGWGVNRTGQHYGMPALLHGSDPEVFIMINEANVLNTNGSYCISHLTGTAERALSLEFAPEEHGRPIPSPTPFQSPWRYLLVTNTLNDLVQATLNYNLNPPSIIDDTSWIQPVRALWAWWASDYGAQLYSEAKRYVDFAVAMGFEAVVLDAGWDETWIQDFCKYAHARGVSPWLWTAMQHIDTFEKANHYLPLWKSWGIDGVKIDFFENDSRHTASTYQMMAEIMKDQRLMINFHGSTKPMGEGRTWPHFMTAEGIMGLEHYKWSGMPDARHNCTVPFIRNAAGPMDYTPVGFSNANRNTSLAHQMALAAVFESGCMHYSASIFHMEAWEGLPFLRRVKAKYDGVRVLSGFPGDHAAILRWVDASQEYIVGIVANAKRTLRLDFSFLPDGEFEAEYYADNRHGNALTLEKLKVNNTTSLDIAMPEHGGAGLYIAPKIAPLPDGEGNGYMGKTLCKAAALDARVLNGSEKAHLSGSTYAIILHSAAEFIIDGVPSDGLYELRFTYMSEEPWEAEISDGRSTMSAYMMASGAPGISVAWGTAMPLAAGASRIYVRRVSGKAPIITSLRVVDSRPAQTLSIPVELGIVSGGAQLIQNGAGAYTAAGLGLGGEIRFDNIFLPEDGRYLLRIEYEAGVDGRSLVSVNGGEPVRANLGGIGVWGATKRGEILAREILIPMRKGGNAVSISAPNAALPHITRLVFTREG